MTTAQVVETSVTVNNNSPSPDYVHLDDQTQPFEMTPGFKPFTDKMYDNNFKIHIAQAIIDIINPARSCPTVSNACQGLHSLEKSLNFMGSPRKVLEFHFSLKSP